MPEDKDKVSLVLLMPKRHYELITEAATIANRSVAEFMAHTLVEVSRKVIETNDEMEGRGKGRRDGLDVQ